MRLSEDTVNVIRQAVRALDPAAEVYLHGSRLDDSARGGDIDLLVVSDILTFRDVIHLRRAILDRIGWQQLDLIVRRREQLTDPFVVHCLTNGLKL